MAQRDWWCLSSTRMQVWSTAGHSRLKDPGCCSCSLVCSFSLNSIPGPGTPHARERSKKKKKPLKTPSGSFHVVQQVKDLGLPWLWHRPQLRCKFDPVSWELYMPWFEPSKPTKRHSIWFMKAGMIMRLSILHILETSAFFFVKYLFTSFAHFSAGFWSPLTHSIEV